MAQVQIVGEDLLIDGVVVMSFKPGVGVYERGQLKDWLEATGTPMEETEAYNNGYEDGKADV